MTKQKKWLKFEGTPGGYYTARSLSGDFIGDILPPGEGEVFKRRAVFTTDYAVEFTAECLRQIADQLDQVEQERRATSHNNKRNAT